MSSCDYSIMALKTLIWNRWYDPAQHQDGLDNTPLPFAEDGFDFAASDLGLACGNFLAVGAVVSSNFSLLRCKPWYVLSVQEVVTNFM